MDQNINERKNMLFERFVIIRTPELDKRRFDNSQKGFVDRP